MDLFDLFASIGLDISEYESNIDEVQSGADSASDALEQIGDAATSAESGLEGAGDAGDSAAGGMDSASSAADSASSALDNVGNAADSAESSVSALDVAFGSLAAQGISQALSSIGGLITGTVTTADNIDKMSQKLGITTDEYQEWAYICNICGANVDNLRTGMKTLNNVISDAAEGSASANAKLEAVGLTIEDLNGLSQNEQLSIVVGALQNMEASAQRSAAANDLLGKTGTDLSAVFNMTAEETDALRQEAYDLGIIMSEDAVKAGADLNDSMTRVKSSFSGMAGTLAAEVMPGLSEFLDFVASDVIGGLASVADGSADVDEVLTNIFTTIGEMGMQAFDSFVQAVTDIVPKVLEALPQLVESIVEFVTDAAPDILQGGIEMLTGLIDAIPDFIESLLEALPDIIDSITGFFVDSVPDIIESAVEMLNGIVEAIPDTISAIIENLPQIIESIVTGLTEAAPQVLQGAITLFTSIIEAIPQIVVSLVGALPEIITTIVTSLIEAAPQILEAAITMLTEIVTAIPQIAKDVIGAVPEIITGLVQGLLSGATSVLNAAKELGSNILSGIKGFLGINSPSTVMEEQGRYITEGLVEGIDTMPGQVEAVLSQVEGIIENWGSGIASNIANTAQQMVTQFISTVQQMPNQLQSILETALSATTSWGDNMFQTAQLIAQNVQEAVITTMEQMVEQMNEQENVSLADWQTFGQNWLQNATETAAQVLNTVVENMNNMATQVQTILSGILSNVQSWGTSVISEFKTVGENAMSGLVQGLDSGSGAVYNKVREIARKMVSEMENELDIGSPSKVFEDDVGEMIGKGLAIGIENSMGAVNNAMDNLMSLTDVGDEVSSAIKTYSGDEAKDSSKAKPNITINQYINSEKATAADLMREARLEQQRAVLMGVA